MINYLFFTSLFACGFDVILGIYIFLKKPKNIIHITFSLFLCSYALWIFGDFFYFFKLFNIFDPTILVRISHIGTVFLPALFVHFSLKAIDIKIPKIYLYILYGIAGLFEIMNIFSPLFISNAVLLVNPITLKVDIGLFYYLYLIEVLALFIFIHIFWLFKYKKSTDLVQLRIRYFFLSLFIIFLSAVFYVPYVMGLFNLRLDNFFLVIYASTMAYAITKTDLLDIKVVITRSLAYIFVFILAMISVFIVNSLKLASFEELILYSLLVISWGLLLIPLREKIQTSALETWISDFYNSETVFDNISEKLLKILETDKALGIVAQELKIGMKLRNCYYLAPQNQNDDHRLFNLFDLEQKQIMNFKADQPIIDFFKTQNVVSYKELEKNILEDLKPLNLDKPLFLSIYSSGQFEGLLILDHKISEASFDNKDQKLLLRIEIYLRAVLDRSKPYEDIKAKYEKSLEFAEIISKQSTYATMIQGIAHELNNPLNLIKGGADIIPNVISEPEKLLNLSAIISRGVVRSTEVLENMINYSQTNSLVSTKKDISINDLIKEVVRISSFNLEKSNIKANLNLSDLPLIKADEISLHQALLNILINSIQAIEKDGEITITTKKESFINKNKETHNGISIEISDNGKGIPPENLKRISEPFFTTKYSAQSQMHMGIGLSITFKIIDEHKGLIEVTSKVGKGTNFKIYLPILA